MISVPYDLTAALHKIDSREIAANFTHAIMDSNKQGAVGGVWVYSLVCKQCTCLYLFGTSKLSGRLQLATTIIALLLLNRLAGHSRGKLLPTTRKFWASCFALPHARQLPANRLGESPFLGKNA